MSDEKAARDATHWAKSVTRLDVSEVPDGAVNINVAGRRLASPIQGAPPSAPRSTRWALPCAR